MTFELQTSRRLHEEHEATLALLGRFEQALARARQAPQAGDDAWARLAREVAGALEREIGQHFGFEERSIFPLLHEAGEGDIATLLADEHAVILEAGGEVIGLLRSSVEGPLAPPQWSTLKAVGAELVERMVSHIQKEEMALLPAIETALDAGRDQELILAYTAD